MPRAEVLQNDVDNLLSHEGSLAVVGVHRWKRGAHKSGARADVPIEIRDPMLRGVVLKIVITVSYETDKRDFVLLWNNIPVRRLCINGSHTNKHTNTERWLRKTHKHKWTDHCLDRFAYTPTDITSDDVYGQFAEFCAECRIACEAKLGELPAHQGDLQDDV
jgi:hypothetical protein